MNEMDANTATDTDTFTDGDADTLKRPQKTHSENNVSRASGHLRLVVPFSLSFHASPRFNYFLNHIRLRAM